VVVGFPDDAFDCVFEDKIRLVVCCLKAADEYPRVGCDDQNAFVQVASKSRHGVVRSAQRQQ